jgi:citrate lyase subunit beta/citryl-CoA lyase
LASPEVKEGRPAVKPCTSYLFLPAHRAGWAEKAARSGSQAVILDLEDAVPDDAKEDAREVAARSISWLSARRPDVVVLVRPNGLESGLTARDLDAVLVPGLHGLLLPMVRTADDVRAFEDLVAGIEPARAGLDKVAFIPSLETAQSVANCEALATASPRVWSLQAAAARGADIEREIGFEFSEEGLETLYLRSRAVLACRANGLEHPLVGVWQDIKNLEGLRRYARQNRGLGFRGQLIIHPSHAHEVNAVYGAAPQVLDRYGRMVRAFDEAVAAGHGAVDFEGEHIDKAHIQTARDYLAGHEQSGEH